MYGGGHDGCSKRICTIGENTISELNKQNNNGPFKIVNFSNIVIANAPYKFNTLNLLKH